MQVSGQLRGCAWGCVSVRGMCVHVGVHRNGCVCAECLGVHWGVHTRMCAWGVCAHRHLCIAVGVHLIVNG